MSTILPRDKALFHKTNKTNKHGFMGITFRSRTGLFEARIRVPGSESKLYCGASKDPAIAARKYDEKAIELFGEEAVTNFEYENERT